MIYDLSYLWVMSHACNILPTCILWNPEYVFCCIFVTIFFKAISFSNKLIISFLKTIADIFEEDETKNHILILRRGQITTKFFCTVPDTILNRLLFDNLCFLCHIVFGIDFNYCSVSLSRYFTSTLKSFAILSRVFKSG